MCHKLGLKNEVDGNLAAIGSKKRYAEGQIASEHLADAAELIDETGNSVYCHDQQNVTLDERNAVKKSYRSYFTKAHQVPAAA